MFTLRVYPAAFSHAFDAPRDTATSLVTMPGAVSLDEPVRLVEHGEHGPTGRTMLGKVVTALPVLQALGDVAHLQDLLTVRWAAATSRPPSGSYEAQARHDSNHRMPAVVLCVCGHTRTLHTDGRTFCTFCECTGFEPKESP